MVNQLNRGDDFRTMEVLIEPGILHDSGHPNDDLYSCKFTESGIKAEAEDKEKTFFPPLKITPVPTTILRPANLTYQLSK
jgi:hypothetical protein